jgi:hypothetical protein
VREVRVVVFLVRAGARERVVVAPSPQAAARAALGVFRGSVEVVDAVPPGELVGVVFDSDARMWGFLARLPSVVVNAVERRVTALGSDWVGACVGSEVVGEFVRA